MVDYEDTGFYRKSLLTALNELNDNLANINHSLDLLWQVVRNGR